MRNIILALVCILFSFSANAAFQSRLGGLAYYDDLQDITWLADANAAGTTMTWVDAKTWVAGLSVTGVAGWRLPTTTQPDSSCSGQGTVSFGTGCTGSEMGHLTNVDAIRDTAPGDFQNVQSGLYWSSTEMANDTLAAWRVDFRDGDQRGLYKGNFIYAWAVHDGDVASVPLPASIWLFLSALGGLGIIKRKRR